MRRRAADACTPARQVEHESGGEGARPGRRPARAALLLDVEQVVELAVAGAVQPGGVLVGSEPEDRAGRVLLSRTSIMSWWRRDSTHEP